MTAIGYALLSEEHPAPALVRHAVRAEQAGFSFAAVSDHFHPWLNVQGESPFAWATLGAIAEATATLTIGTAVTCPTTRIHPAIVAQAAATMGTLAPGRFFLGVGSGENLNEHVLGDHWPVPAVRMRMLREAIEVIRALWSGEERSFEGEFYTVEHARLYSVPDDPVPLLIAASGSQSGTLAAEMGDGLISVVPDAGLVERWRDAGGEGPRIGMMHLVYGPDREQARQTFAQHWAHAPLPGFMNADLRRPAEFEAAASGFRPEDYDGDETPLGPEAGPILDRIAKFEHAGYDHVLLHQIGPDQEAFLRFFEETLVPHLELTPAWLSAGEPGSQSDL